MFQLFLLVLSVFIVNFASAAPRMDSAIGSNTGLFATVLPDHENANLYYVFPQSSDVLLRDNGLQDFTYIEERKYTRRGYKVKSAQLNVGIRLSIAMDLLQQKIAEIKNHNPNAKFAVVTAYKTEVVGEGEFSQFFRNSNCTDIAGPLEVPVYCTVHIMPEMSYGFRKIVKSTQTRVFHYVYHFYGSVGGNLKEFSFSVPLKVGSLENGPYFFDQYGSQLESLKLFTADDITK